MKYKEIIIYILKIILNYGVGYILNCIFSKNGIDYTILYSYAFIIISCFVNAIVCQKLNYTLDLFSNQYVDYKHLIFNSILIGDLLSFIIIMFISVIF